MPMPVDNGEQNHRKRRRNRMRVSCLNCYASKRKCDRKRPCTRCIQHGLTGLCVYELDDPISRDADQLDETTRLRNRIAELESVIRELNNRPHPRWFAPGGVRHDPALVALRRGTRNRPNLKLKPDSLRSTSVEAFFDSIADDRGNRGDDSKMKIKKEDEFIPEFTPSDTEPHSYVGSLSPLTPLSPLSRDSNSPCSYRPSSCPSASGSGSASNALNRPSSTLLNLDAVDSCGSTGMPNRSPTNCPSSSASDTSEEGPPLYLLYPYDFESRSMGSVSDRDDCADEQVFATIRDTSLGHPCSRANVAIQTSPRPSHNDLTISCLDPFQTDTGAISVCQCLTDTAVFSPLVHFASALRMAREALEGLPDHSSDCLLLSRVMELDEQIFTASPPTPQATPPPPPAKIHELYPHIQRSPPTPVLAPSSPLPRLVDSAMRHPHAHSLPFYSPASATLPDGLYSSVPFMETAMPTDQQFQLLDSSSPSFSCAESGLLTYPADYPQLPLRSWS